MSKKTVRFSPYYMENPEDERIPNAVAGYAALFKDGFVLDLTQVSDWNDGTKDYLKRWGAKVGTDQGLNVTFQETISPEDGNPTAILTAVSTFGMPPGCSATVRYEATWEAGSNRSSLELDVEGPDDAVNKIESAFRKEFAPPSDHDFDKIKKHMNAALNQLDMGTVEDAAQAILLWRPEDTDALLAMSTAMIMRRDNAGAEKYLQKLLQLQPNSYQAHLNMGSVWMDRQDYDKAIEQYQAMVDLKPNESFAPFILATAYEAKGDTANALELYRKAASLPNSPGPTDYPNLAREAMDKLEHS